MRKLGTTAMSFSYLTLPDKMIYESDRYIVVTNNDTVNPCFEIVEHPVKDGDFATEAFLHGESARYLYDCIKSWQMVTPEQSQVEATLATLSWCNVQVLVVH